MASRASALMASPRPSAMVQPRSAAPSRAAVPAALVVPRAVVVVLHQVAVPQVAVARAEQGARHRVAPRVHVVQSDKFKVDLILSPSKDEGVAPSGSALVVRQAHYEGHWKDPPCASSPASSAANR